MKIFSRPASVFLLAVAACLSLRLGETARAISYEFVTVGNPGNRNDDTGYGAVGYEYRIGKFEITLDQYAEYLNAIYLDDGDMLDTYNPQLAAQITVSGISSEQVDGRTIFRVTSPQGPNPYGVSAGQRPVSYMTWFMAARFANWMANGQPKGALSPRTTEDGAYTLNGVQSGTTPPRNAINPNTGARPGYWIPTEHEWYKAAYYSPELDDGRGGYHLYATQSDDVPGNRIGGSANQANAYRFVNGGYSFSTRDTLYFQGGAAAKYSQNYLTDVGAFSGSESFYGTYDQNGNLWEWNDLEGGSDSSKGIRGGNWDYNFQRMQATNRLEVPAEGESSWSSNGQYYGVRLAGTVAPVADITVIDGTLLTQGEAGYEILEGSGGLRKQGAGVLVLDKDNLLSGITEIWQGELALARDGALSGSEVAVGNGGLLTIGQRVRPDIAGLTLTPEALVDVTTGALTVVEGLSPEELRGALIQGRGNGSWNGLTGITSSAVAADAESGIVRAVGWKENPDGSVTVAYAAPGDVNLDGEVNVFDMVSVTSSGKYGEGVASVWGQGDFDYNGVTDIFDMVLVNGAGVYGAGNYLPDPPAATSIAAVPEPSLGLLVLTGMGSVAYAGYRRHSKRL